MVIVYFTTIPPAAPTPLPLSRLAHRIKASNQSSSPPVLPALSPFLTLKRDGKEDHLRREASGALQHAEAFIVIACPVQQVSPVCRGQPDSCRHRTRETKLLLCNRPTHTIQPVPYRFQKVVRCESMTEDHRSDDRSLPLVELFKTCCMVQRRSSSNGSISALAFSGWFVLR